MDTDKRELSELTLRGISVQSQVVIPNIFQWRCWNTVNAMRQRKSYS